MTSPLIFGKHQMSIIVNNGSTVSASAVSPITVDGTILGLGVLDGAGTLTGAATLNNLGTIAGDQTGGVIDIETGTLANNGTVLATTGTIVVGSAVAVTNYTSAASTLNSGIWIASGSGELDFNPGAILTDNAAITLDGTGAVFNVFDPNQSIDVPIENLMTTVGTSGVLSILGGRSFTASDSLMVNGTVALGGGQISAPNGVTVGSTGKIIGFGTVNPNISSVDSGTIEAQNGTLALGASSQVTGQGVFQVDAGATLVLQPFTGAYTETILNNGTIDAAFANISGTLTVGGTANPVYSGSGSFKILGGVGSGNLEVLDLEGTVSANVAFDSNNGELVLGSPSLFGGTIAHFANNDTLVLGNIGHATTATLSGSTLSIKNGTTLLKALTLDTGSVNYFGTTPASFTVVDNAGNTKAFVTVANAQQAACYAAGTNIRTEAGEVAVEDLKAGDIVAAHFARTAPVVWVGHRHVDCRRHPDPVKVWPVRVAAHAFGPRVPHRDLLLSPDHAVFTDGMLIPVKHLINGTTIQQVKMDTVTYYHIELAEHDVLLAEGLPAESYLENGDRHAFDNGGGPVMLHPEFGARRWEALGCAPMVVTGSALDAVRARLLARAPKPKRRARAA